MTPYAVGQHKTNLIYLLMFGSSGLLLYSISISQNIIFTRTDFINGVGIVSQFPFSYWVGFTLLLVLCIFLALGSDDHTTITYLLSLVLTGAYLFGFIIAIQRIPSESSYTPFFTVDNILQTGHLQLSIISYFFYYYQLPGFTILNANILDVTGLPTISLLSIMPYFGIFAFPTILFAGSRRAGLSRKGSFIAVLFTTSVWIWSFAGYEYPRLLSMLLFLLILTLALCTKLTRREAVLIIIAFTTIVITHSVTALATYCALFLFLLYRRKYVLLVTLSSVLVGWYIYVSWQFIMISWSGIIEGQSGLTLHIQNLLSGTNQLSLLLVRYLTLYDISVFGLILIVTLVLLIRHRFDNFKSRRIISIILLVFGVALVFPIFTSSESIYRLFLCMAFPLAIAFVFLLEHGKMIKVVGVIVVSIVMVASPVVNYGTDLYHYFTPEDGMVNFYSTYQINQSFYYLYDEGIMWLHNLSFNGNNLARWAPGLAYSYSGMSLSPVVITSYLSTTIYGPPYSLWPNSLVGQNANRVFDNGYSQVFLNRFVTN